MDRAIEYNLINNIPILYPTNQKQKIFYNPRYTIADSNKLLQCFNDNKIKIKYFEGQNLYYVKIPINKKFHTLNNEISALYCFLIVENNYEYDIEDFSYDTLIYWITNRSNHYVIITTPILQYKDVYYSISNNNELTTVFFDEIELADNEMIINKFIQNNCFTICDNYNIIISLYHQNIITKYEFVELIHRLNDLKYMYYTNEFWLFQINNHRILNASDFPIIFLSLKPHMVDAKFINLFNWTYYDDDMYNIFMQTIYQDRILYTTIISASYPYINTNYLNIVLGDNCINKNFTNTFSILGTRIKANNDYYGFFASVAKAKSMRKYWDIHKKYIVSNYFENNDNINIIIDIFVPLFCLYNNGYEDIKITKKIIHNIWNELLSMMDKNTRTNCFETLCILNNRIHVKVPYIFIQDILNCIDIFENKLILVNTRGFYVYKYTNLFKLIQNNDILFAKKIIQKKIFQFLLCIYRKFQMFSHNQSTDKYLVGKLIINYVTINYIT